MIEIVGAIIGGLFTLLGVWLAYYLQYGKPQQPNLSDTLQDKNISPSKTEQNVIKVSQKTYLLPVNQQIALSKQNNVRNGNDVTNFQNRSIKRQPFEKIEEYQVRLQQIVQNFVIVGRTTLISEQYDIDTQHFLIHIQWDEYIKENNPSISEVLSDTFIIVERDIAKKLFESITKDGYLIAAKLNLPVKVTDSHIYLSKIYIGMESLYLHGLEEMFIIYQISDAIVYQQAIQENAISAYQNYLYKSPHLLKAYTEDIECRLIDEMCWLSATIKRSRTEEFDWCHAYLSGELRGVSSGSGLKMKYSTNEYVLHKDEALKYIDELCWEKANSQFTRGIKSYKHYLTLNHPSLKKRKIARAYFFNNSTNEWLIPHFHLKDAQEALRPLKIQRLKSSLSFLVIFPALAGFIGGIGAAKEGFFFSSFIVGWFLGMIVGAIILIKLEI